MSSETLFSFLEERLKSDVSDITALEQLSEHTPHTSAQESSSVTEFVLGLSAKFIANVPKEELIRLPHDGAEQHDHYIYGTPKI